MSEEHYKTVVRKWFEAVNSPDWETETRAFARDTAAWEAWRDEFRAFRESFPDYHNELEGMIAEGDQVAVWSTVSGTFSKPYAKGGLGGIEPQGQKLSWREVYVVDFGGDELDMWLMVDELDRMRQLGVDV
ncbi:MAG: ester cyclase [Candidatus Promineifilaceae bacterium]|nr:ester cyclase [Candidatus Promineifilaceae bacterium]